MATKHLTDAVVRRLEPPATGNRITYDTVTKGFGARVTAAGARSYVLTYLVRATGRQRRYTIGSADHWMASDARAEAKRLKMLIDQGGDPLRDIEDERAAPVMAKLIERFREEHLPRLREKTRIDYRGMITNYVVPHFGERVKVADVRFADVDALHRSITRDGYKHRANRVASMLSKMFELSIKWGWRETNPVKGVEHNREHARRRYLSPEELQRLTKALAEFSEKDIADAVRLLLLTGARRGEVLSMKWTDLDLTAGTWSKPPSSVKQNDHHQIPLSAPARQLLAERLRRKTDDEFVFPGRGDRDHLGDFWHSWRKLCKAAGLENFRLHDLRHSYASQLASGGASLPLIGALLGHTQPQTTARYSHLFDDPLRKATEQVGAIIESAAGKPPSAEVVPLKGRVP
jgi:integrase